MTGFLEATTGKGLCYFLEELRMNGVRDPSQQLVEERGLKLSNSQRCRIWMNTAFSKVEVGMTVSVSVLTCVDLGWRLSGVAFCGVELPPQLAHLTGKSLDLEHVDDW